MAITFSGVNFTPFAVSSFSRAGLTTSFPPSPHHYPGLQVCPPSRRTAPQQRRPGPSAQAYCSQAPISSISRVIFPSTASEKSLTARFTRSVPQRPEAQTVFQQPANSDGPQIRFRKAQTQTKQNKQKPYRGQPLWRGISPPRQPPFLSTRIRYLAFSRGGRHPHHFH